MSPPQPPAELNCTQKLVLFSLLLHIAYSQQHYTRLAKEHNAENLQLKLLATKAEGLSDLDQACFKLTIFGTLIDFGERLWKVHESSMHANEKCLLELPRNITHDEQSSFECQLKGINQFEKNEMILLLSKITSNDENVENINRMTALMLSVVFSAKIETYQSIIQRSKEILEKYINNMHVEHDTQAELMRVTLTKGIPVLYKILTIVELLTDNPEELPHNYMEIILSIYFRLRQISNCEEVILNAERATDALLGIISANQACQGRLKSTLDQKIFASDKVKRLIAIAREPVELHLR